MSELKDHWHAFHCTMMFTCHDSTSVFGLCISLVRRDWCTETSVISSEMLLLLLLYSLPADRCDTSGLEQPVISDLTVFVVIFIILKEQWDNMFYWKLRGKERKMHNWHAWQKYWYCPFNTVINSFWWLMTEGLDFISYFWPFAKTIWNQLALQLQMNKKLI